MIEVHIIVNRYTGRILYHGEVHGIATSIWRKCKADVNNSWYHHWRKP